MAFDVINTGTTANDGTGDPLRTAFTKVNDNTAKAVEGAASSTDGTVVTFDGTTGKVVKASSKVTADLVTGPASATSGNVAAFDGTSGKLLQNTTKVVADIVTGPASATSGRVAVYNGTTGKLLQDGTKAEADLVIGPASATDGRVAVFDQTTGKLLKDGTKAEADLVVGPASATDGAVALYDQTTGKLLKDGPVPGAANGLATLDAAQTHLLSETPLGITRGYVYPLGVKTYFNSHIGTTGNGTTVGVNRIAASPVYLPKGTVTEFRLEITTASPDVGAKVRLGLYDGFGNLVVDAGQVEADSTGVKIASTSVVVASGVYIIAYVAQDQVSVPSTKRYVAGQNVFAPRFTSGVSGFMCWTSGPIYSGVLPSTLSVSSVTTVVPQVLVGVDL